MNRETKRRVAFFLHKALLSAQTRARKARLKASTGIDPLISNYLPVLLPHLPATVEDLARMFCMKKQSCAALIESFKQQDILCDISDPASGWLVGLSTLGQQMVPAVIAADRKIEEALIGCLSADERSRLTELLAALNDSLAVLPERALTGETDFVAEQKTLARASGMLGGDYLRSGFNLGVVHLFEHLLANKGGSFLAASKEIMPLSGTELDKLFQDMVQRGLLEGQPEKEALSYVLLTPAGQKTAVETQERCVDAIFVAVDRLGAEEGLELTALLYRLAQA